MARYTESKCRLCRKEGRKLFLKGERCFSPKCPLERKGAVPPGQHGLKARRRMSEYKEQLREKQKAKQTYGVLERQFRNYFQKALAQKGSTGPALFQFLESRLDNVIYRLGFVPSRSGARQLVRHGHILVDNRRVDIPSYQLKSGQIISLSPKAIKIPIVQKSLKEKREVPSWLQRKAAVGKIVGLPQLDDLGAEINKQLIVEYYSR